jgi:hypothetical protein
VVTWVKSRSGFPPGLQEALQYREYQDNHAVLHTPEYQPRASATASWRLYIGQIEIQTKSRNIILPHANPADIHCGKHLILLSCLSQKCKDIEFQPLYVRMMVRITKFKEELENHGGLCKMNDFVVRFKLWWRETSSADFEVHLVNPKEDTVAGLKCDIRVGCIDYSPPLIRLDIFVQIQHLQRAETAWSEPSFRRAIRLLCQGPEEDCMRKLAMKEIGNIPLCC